MSKLCPMCGRHHSGLCGIPRIGVKIGAGTTGARAVRGQTPVPDSYSVSARSGKSKQGAQLAKRSLEELLDWGMEQERNTAQMLKVLPSEMPEYQQLLERLDRVISTNHQVRAQIALRRS